MFLRVQASSDDGGTADATQAVIDVIDSSCAAVLVDSRWTTVQLDQVLHPPANIALLITRHTRYGMRECPTRWCTVVPWPLQRRLSSPDVQPRWCALGHRALAVTAHCEAVLKIATTPQGWFSWQRWTSYEGSRR